MIIQNSRVKLNDIFVSIMLFLFLRTRCIYFILLDNYSSFWTSVRVKHTTTFDTLGLGKSKVNQWKCKKFDNITQLKYQPDDCSNLYGFICERGLFKHFSKFQDKQNEYHVQPLQQVKLKIIDKRSYCLLLLTFLNVVQLPGIASRVFKARHVLNSF